jgi:hypothetical protein
MKEIAMKMSKAEFNAKMDRIEKEVDARREKINARQEQELARLAEESGWPLEKIKERMKQLLAKRNNENEND